MEYVFGKTENINGSIECSSSKNFVSTAMVLSLISDEPSTIKFSNITQDIGMTVDMLRSTGAIVELGETYVTIDPTCMDSSTVQQSPLGGNRMPVLLVTSLLKKFQSSCVPLPEGCKIGERKFDVHSDALKAFGIGFGCNACIHAEKTLLQPANVNLSFNSVGATINCLIAASISEGRSILNNIAIEPEIVELVKMLQKMGVEAKWLPGRSIEINSPSHLKGVTINSFNDRIEASFFGLLSVATNSIIRVNNVIPEYIVNVLGLLDKIGAEYEVVDNGIVFKGAKPIIPVHFSTSPYPGIPTDIQPFVAVALSQADGLSTIHETVFEKRLGYAQQLGIKHRLEKSCYGEQCRFHNEYYHTLRIYGPSKIEQEVFEATNLREGYAFIIASLLSEKKSRITNMEMVEKSYPCMYDKLRSLGINVTRVM